MREVKGLLNSKSKNGREKKAKRMETKLEPVS